MAEGYQPRTLLVTGGAGFIGSAVVRHLMALHPTYRVRRTTERDDEDDDDDDDDDDGGGGK